MKNLEYIAPSYTLRKEPGKVIKPKEDMVTAFSGHN